jgi:hypothetical protein
MFLRITQLLQDPRAFKVRRVLKAILAIRVFRDQEVFKVLEDLRAFKVYRVFVVQLVHRVFKDHKARKAQQ